MFLLLCTAVLLNPGIANPLATSFQTHPRHALNGCLSMLWLQARKSVGAEVNYGIRFTTEAEAEKFLDDLAGEVSSRMRAAGVKGKHLTLKVKRRQEGAPQPAKFMGHGPCDNLSRSVTLSSFVETAAEIARVSDTKDILILGLTSVMHMDCKRLTISLFPLPHLRPFICLLLCLAGVQSSTEGATRRSRGNTWYRHSSGQAGQRRSARGGPPLGPAPSQGAGPPKDGV